MNPILRYLLNYIIWIDCGINFMIFLGSPYETMSSRCGRNYPNAWFTKVINFIFIWQDPNHCQDEIIVNVEDNAILK